MNWGVCVCVCVLRCGSFRRCKIASEESVGATDVGMQCNNCLNKATWHSAALHSYFVETQTDCEYSYTTPLLLFLMLCYFCKQAVAPLTQIISTGPIIYIFPEINFVPINVKLGHIPTLPREWLHTALQTIKLLLWKQRKWLPTWPWPLGPELGSWEHYPKAESHITSEEDKTPKSGSHHVWMELNRDRKMRWL